MFQRVGCSCSAFVWCSAGVVNDGWGVLWGVFQDLQGGVVKCSGWLLQVPGVCLNLFQALSKYKFFSPGIQVDIFFLDFGVFGNATWILKSSWRLRLAREGFEA